MATNIPKTQRAAVRQGTKDNFRVQVQEIPVPTPGRDEILVKINYSGLCSSDKTIMYHEQANMVMDPRSQYIGGHEGAGTVVSVGENVGDLWSVGDRAGIKWITTVCRRCEFCTNGQDECHCLGQRNSGYNVAGTFQEYVVTDAHYATRIPEGVKDEEAGPVMCGGLTAYVACKRSGLRPGQWIIISGAGGGLGHFGVQYARAMGFRVIAIDTGADKRDLCLKLGAEHFLDFAEVPDMAAEVARLTTYGAHAAIVFSATRSSYEQAPHIVRIGGTVVCIGLPHDQTVVAGAPPVLMCFKKLTVVGSVTGTRKEAEEALDFTARGLVRPVLTHGRLEDIEKLCQDLRDGTLAGRAVLKIGA